VRARVLVAQDSETGIGRPSRVTVVSRNPSGHTHHGVAVDHVLQQVVQIRGAAGPGQIGSDLTPAPSSRWQGAQELLEGVASLGQLGRAEDCGGEARLELLDRRPVVLVCDADGFPDFGEPLGQRGIAETGDLTRMERGDIPRGTTPDATASSNARAVAGLVTMAPTMAGRSSNPSHG
jgi:hypothetical protein